MRKLVLAALGGTALGLAVTTQVAGPLVAQEAERNASALMGPGGVVDCGNAQNCVKVCPKEIPLTESIGAMGRAVTMHAITSWFRK